MEPIKLSVRRVVEHALRCGDIDSRFADPAAMQMGSRLHRRIQRAMGPEYRREVALRMEVAMRGIPVVLQGRADGVIIDQAGGLTVDEIKSTTLSLERIFEQRELHLGQAKCYAWMLLRGMESPPDEVTVQLTYYQLDTDELRRHRFPYSREELEAFFSDLLERYGVWLEFERDWKELRDRTIRETGFPYPAYRRGQRELAVTAYRVIEQEKKLYAQAPTGIGKTLSALFPSIKAMGEGKAEKLFYLTAKTVTREVAEGAVRLMAAEGLRFKSITLRAKDKICPREETICNPDHCERARGHYDRVNDALLDLLRNNDLITPEVVGEYARRHRVCPHETALDAALWCDLVVGDYNHMFDPTVYLKRFFADGGGDYVFLIDEAHNLGDRVREMYTADLRKSKFYRIKKELKDKNKPAARLRKALGQVNDYLLELRKQCPAAGTPAEAAVRVTYPPEKTAGPEEEAPDEEPTADEHPAGGAEDDARVLATLVLLFTAAAEEWLAIEANGGHALHGDVLELYFEANAFLGISERYDGHFVTITEVFGSEVVHTLYCLDPSDIIREMLGRAKASILFSATLTPLPYYREMLGGAEEDRMLALPSPFEEERLLLAAHCGISTKYVDREASIAPIAEAVRLMTSRRRGNYLVFFPSHEYMRRVHGAFCERYPQVETLLQQSSMDEEARAGFLRRFDAENAETLVGFCVLGGIFSEGIDLKGERLIGSIIVGVGLPGISLRQDLIRDYFNKKNGHGYDYAYVFPGMNKVLQAAGRVIRTESDYGVVLLIDSRFGTAQYRALYPKHWSRMQYLRGLEELERCADGFFEGLADSH